MKSEPGKRAPGEAAQGELEGPASANIELLSEAHHTMEVRLKGESGAGKAYALSTQQRGGRLGVLLQDADGGARYMLSDSVSGVDLAPDEFIGRVRRATSVPHVPLSLLALVLTHCLTPALLRSAAPRVSPLGTDIRRRGESLPSAAGRTRLRQGELDSSSCRLSDRVLSFLHLHCLPSDSSLSHALRSALQLVRMVSFRGEDAPVFQYVGQSNGAEEEDNDTASSAPPAPLPFASPSKGLNNSYAALEDAAEEPEESLDPRMAARVKRMQALSGRAVGVGGGDTEPGSDAPEVTSASMPSGGAPEAASTGGGGGDTSTNDLWSMLAGMTPGAPAPSTTSASGAAVAAVVADSGGHHPKAVAKELQEEEEEEEDEEEETQNFGWSAALSAGANPAAAAPEDDAASESAGPVASTSASHTALPPRSGNAKHSQQQQQQRKQAPAPRAPDEWPWSVGLDHRLKERAVAAASSIVDSEDGITAGRAAMPPPPTPPPSRVSSAASLAGHPGLGNSGSAASNSAAMDALADGVGAKLLRKMGWQPDDDTTGSSPPKGPSLPTGVTTVPLPRPDRLGLGVPTPAEQAAREAATAALEAAAGGNAQMKMALMMSTSAASSSASATATDLAWDDARGGAGKSANTRKASAGHQQAPPESWETSAAATLPPSSGAARAAGAPGVPLCDATRNGVTAMKKLLVAHLRGMEDCLEIAAGDAVKHGDEEAAVALLRRMQHVLESVIQGPAWKSLQEE